MSIEALQKKIGVKADGDFGPATLKAAADYFKLSRVRAAHFFAQTAHETGGFRSFSENLNYSPDGLRKVFPKYFPTDAMAAQFARKPERIAVRVYGGRMGNDPEPSRDGWLYRGRGALQLTGYDNYKAFGDSLKRPDVMSNPDLVANDLAFESAIWFFDKNGLWAICDKGINDTAIMTLTKRINGGTHGYDDRKAKTYQYAEWLKIG